MPEFREQWKVGDFLSPAPEMGPDMYRATTDIYDYKPGQVVSKRSEAALISDIREHNRAVGYMRRNRISTFEQARAEYSRVIQDIDLAETVEAEYVVRREFSP